ncbi:ATP-binding protein [Paenisporosarcina indica]|uniref:ATP-binding protein n=1 Tax=Paenisporosarcina indica TaxID=650093 RepID=UPI00094FF4B6|nr:AAA family ATPase [Paenisporosarcina indica]
MRIQKLVIYGFGQHEDIMIELKDGINVFFGRNEAGKTTIQQFLLSVLFGFPLRNQGLLRYEPKGGGRHGGQVHIDHPEFGRVVIERVKGKSAGDVTVFFEDGTRGDEESLKKVLFHYDRTSFEGIFSFSIHQLQNFEKMTEEELSRTLLASGTTGVETLTKLEQRATKEMNNLFKKSGKNPEMNVKIEEIRSLEQTLKEERSKIDQYEPAIVRMSEINRRLEELKHQEHQLKQQDEQLSKYLQAKPLLEQKTQLMFQIDEIVQESFPAEGIRRYELLKDRRQELDIQMDQLTHDIEQSENLFKQTLPVERMKEMEDMLSKETEWHHLQLRKQQLAIEMDQLKSEIDQHARLLGIKSDLHFEQVISMDVSLQKEEYFQQIMQNMQQAEESLRFETQSRHRLQAEIQELQRNIEQVQKTAPSEREQQQVTKLQQLIRQVAELKARQQINLKPTVPKTNTSLVIFCVILLAAFSGAFLLQNWWIAAGGILLATFIYVLLKKNNQVSERAPLKDYQSEITALENELTTVEQLAGKVRLYNDRMSLLTQQKDEKEHVLKVIDQNMRQTLQKEDEAKEAFNEFLQQHGFDELLQAKLFPELLKCIRQIQELQQINVQRSNEYKAVIERIQNWLTTMTEVTEESFSENHAYNILRNAYSELKDRLKEIGNTQEKVKIWKSKLAEKQKLYEAQSKNIQTLWNEANVENEAAYYAADAVYRNKQYLQHELNAINSQLVSIGEITVPETKEEPQLDELDSQFNHILSTRNELLEEKATLKQQTSSLLSDERYGHTLQQFEQKKTELAELAHKWSVHKAVTEAIRQTMHNLKEKRLPYVLEKAQQFFNHLTSARYESLEVNEQGVFEAVHVSGTRYHIAELSQATKEQAYISLRFALAESLVDTVPLPILMDDPFVHFDRFRTQQMVQLMTDLENQHQFFYFTCHEDMKTIWPQANVIDVATLRNERSVPST